MKTTLKYPDHLFTERNPLTAEAPHGSTSRHLARSPGPFGLRTISCTLPALVTVLCIMGSPASAQIPNPQASVVFLSASAIALELEQQIDRVRRHEASDSDRTADLIIALSEQPPARDAAEKAEQAKAWSLAATLVRKTHGTTPFVAEALQIASALDPADAELARSAVYEAKRQKIIQDRIDEAGRLRQGQQGIGSENPK